MRSLRSVIRRDISWQPTTCAYGPTSCLACQDMCGQVPAFIGDARPLVEHARCFAAAAEVNRILDTATEAKGDLATFLQERTRPAGLQVCMTRTS